MKSLAECFRKKERKGRHAEIEWPHAYVFDPRIIRRKSLLLLVLSRTFSISRKKRCWRQRRSGDVGKNQIVIEAAEEEKKCPWCGKEMETIGEEKVRSG
ncbi:hypothetical protein [Dubosiella newyorkensis]|uniref:hypothetical protein n=1 Tax=Dubosiella newyorkensis TaxID=1862672 RepID=UPI003F67E152